jgi:hypothetical protein
VGAVVVHRQAAAHVQHAHAGAFAHQVHIHAARLHDARLDAADVGDLRAQVVVQHLEAVQHAPAAQIVHQVNDLGRAQAELAAVAAGLVPMPAAPPASLARTPMRGFTPSLAARSRISSSSLGISMTMMACMPIFSA